MMELKIDDILSLLIIGYVLGGSTDRWDKKRWIEWKVTFKKSDIEIKNCRIMSYNSELDVFTVDKVEGYVPIKYLYWNGFCLEDLE